MCPLALVEIGIFAVVTGKESSPHSYHPLMYILSFSLIILMNLAIGEIGEIWGKWGTLMNSAAPQVVIMSGVLSFSLNVTSFIANKITSPLTLCIAANVKQVLLVCFGTLYFGDPVSTINGLGIVIVIAGSFQYGIVSLREKS